MKESGGETALKFNVVKKSVQSSKGMANIHIMYTCVCVYIYNVGFFLLFKHRMYFGSRTCSFPYELQQPNRITSACFCFTAKTLQIPGKQ